MIINSNTPRKFEIYTTKNGTSLLLFFFISFLISFLIFLIFCALILFIFLDHGKKIQFFAFFIAVGSVNKS